jgi:transposase
MLCYIWAMFSQPQKLPDDVEALKEIVTSQSTQISALEEKVRSLQDRLFGRRSEKYVVNEGLQTNLFDEAEEVVEEKPAEIIVPSHKRKKPGRKPLPKELPRIDVIHDLAEEEKLCECGCVKTRIGEEVCEKLDIIPAKIQVIRHIRYKYACKGCEGVESEEGAVKIAPLPAQIIPQGIATPGLLAHIITSKFVDSLPFYRQEKMFERIGVELSRASMANWTIQVAEHCKPLVDLLEKEIRSGPLINIDETTVQVLKEPDRSNTAKSYMWVFRGGTKDHPLIIYQYRPTRSGEVAKDFIGDYQGYVQTDGYTGYDFLKAKEGIIHVGCWAHARRKFAEALNARKKTSEQKVGSAEIAINYIRKLYAIEKHADENDYTDEQRYELRQEKAKPILDGFKEWLDKKSIQTPPKGLLGKAVNYTLNQWGSLIGYIYNGGLRPDNNLLENTIRPFVVGRKNWLFSGHPRGAEASASLYSLVITAKENSLEPYHYLRFVFEKIPFANTEEDYRKLLPQNVDRKTIKLQSIR